MSTKTTKKLTKKMLNGNDIRINKVKKLPNGWEQAWFQIRIEGGLVWNEEKTSMVCGKGDEKYILVNGEKIFIAELG